MFLIPIGACQRIFKFFLTCRSEPIRCCAKIVNLAIRQRNDAATPQVSLCTTKRSHITAEPPKDDIPDALQFISSDVELPVDGLLLNDEFEWIKTFIDSSPPDVHAYRERVPGYRWTTGSRTYATAYPSLTSTRGRIARNSTSSSAPRPTPWPSASTCASTPSRTASADD